MHTLQAPAENADQLEASETTTPVVDMEKLEAMVTPEQVLSASVARRRRKFSKKRSRSTSRGREQTPARETNGTTSTSETEDEKLASRPKTPERRRRKTRKAVSKLNGNVEKEKLSDVELKEKAQTLRPPEEITVKRDSFADIAQTEFLALYNKAKRSVSRGRERFKKHDKLTVKRSQSTPNQITEQELIESFKKAQLLDNESRRLLKRASSFRKYSTDSSLRSTTPERLIQKPIKPDVKRFVTRRKPRVTSRKIIQVIDPKSFNLVYKQPPLPKIPILSLIKVLRTFSLLEIIRCYRSYKVEMKREYDKIRRLRSRCICELVVLMIYCGLGSVVFKFVEGAFENFYKCGVKRVKRDFIELLWYKSHNLREEDWKSLARNKLRTFEEELHQAHEAGMRTYSGQRSWSFLNGVVYAFTVITTIGMRPQLILISFYITNMLYLLLEIIFFSGYGHIYPTTTTGQALTIVYSIIGIPLFLIALTDFGKLFTRCIKFFWSFVRRLYYTGSCRQVRKTAHVQVITYEVSLNQMGNLPTRTNEQS